MSERDGELAEARRLLSLAAKLSVDVMGAYLRNDGAAMGLFGNNGTHMVARDLAGGLMLFKVKYPPAMPEEA